jgi:hypothetical protein
MISNERYEERSGSRVFYWRVVRDMKKVEIESGNALII